MGVIVVGAGASRRMAGIDKVFTPLLGLPLIVHAVETFLASPIVGAMVIVLAPDKVELGRAIAKERGWGDRTTLCAGGQRRQDSVRLGLKQLASSPWVAVHDAARPCIDAELLERGVEAARETGAAVAAVPAKDTIKTVSEELLVVDTPPRNALWMVQTPQVFRYDLLVEAHRSSEGPDTATDDASLVEAMGHKVKVYPGSYNNLKVTTSEDLAYAELHLKNRRASPSPSEVS